MKSILVFSTEMDDQGEYYNLDVSSVFRLHI